MVKKIVFGLFSLGMCFLLSFQLPDKEVKKFMLLFRARTPMMGLFKNPWLLLKLHNKLFGLQNNLALKVLLR